MRSHLERQIEGLRTGAIMSSVVFLSSRSRLIVSLRFAKLGRGVRGVPERALRLTFGFSDIFATGIRLGSFALVPGRRDARGRLKLKLY